MTGSFSHPIYTTSKDIIFTQRLRHGLWGVIKCACGKIPHLCRDGGAADALGSPPLGMWSARAGSRKETFMPPGPLPEHTASVIARSDLHPVLALRLPIARAMWGAAVTTEVSTD